MTYEAALAKLRTHSSLPPAEPDEGLLDALFQADRDGKLSDIRPYVEDVVASLAVANLELNGSRPSQTLGYRNPSVVSDLAYPVSSLVVGLLQSHRTWSSSGHLPAATLDALRDAALRIGMAWDMLLAGDHDDLRGELEVEWNARFG